MKFEMNDNPKIVKLVLVNCHEDFCGRLKEQSVDFLELSRTFPHENESIKSYLQGADIALVVADITDKKNFCTGFEVLRLANDLKIDRMCIVPQMKFKRVTPYKEYRIPFGEHIEILRENCPVLAVDMVDDSSWGKIADTTIQMYQMISKKNVVENYSDNFDVDILSKILQVQHEYERNLLVTNKSVFFSGRCCGKAAASMAIEVICNTVSKHGFQFPDWVIIQVKHTLGKGIDISENWQTIDTEWVQAVAAIRAHLQPNASIFTQIQLSTAKQEDQEGIDVSIIAPSRSNGLAQRSTSIYKTSMKLEEQHRILEAEVEQRHELQMKVQELNKKLEVHSQQLAKILSMISHNLTPQINMLWSYIEQPNHTQVFRESISSMSLLLDIAKKASSNPKAIKDAMQCEPKGEESVDHLIEDSIKTAVVNLLSERNIASISQHYYAYAMRNHLVSGNLSLESWEESYGSVKQDMQQKWSTSFRETASDQMKDWYKTHLSEITVTVNESTLQFIKHGARYGILQSIFLELIGNAVKYGSSMITGTNAIELSVSSDKEYYKFECMNTIDRNLVSSGKGSGRGHEFINLILETIEQEELVIDRRDERYTVTFYISKMLLGG